MILTSSAWKMNGKDLQGSLRGMSLACIFHESFASFSSPFDKNLIMMHSEVSLSHSPSFTLNVCRYK